jgi:hypothetical protein
MLANRLIAEGVDRRRKSETAPVPVVQGIGKEKDQISRTNLPQDLHELIERQKAEDQKWMTEQGWRNP